MTSASIPYHAFLQFVDYPNPVFADATTYVARKPQPVNPFWNLLKPFDFS